MLDALHKGPGHQPVHAAVTAPDLRGIFSMKGMVVLFVPFHLIVKSRFPLRHAFCVERAGTFRAFHTHTLSAADRKSSGIEGTGQCRVQYQLNLLTAGALN